MLEKKVDSAIVRYAKKLGIIVIKLTTLGARGESGWPDRLFLKLHEFICPNCGHKISMGKAVFMEMKSTDGKSSELQEKKQVRLAEQGFIVYKDINDPDVGKAIIDKEFT